MSNQRQHIRTPITLTVKVTTNTGEEKLKTRDMSDSGLYLCKNEQDLLDIGTLIQVQVLGIDDAPCLKAEIVRHDNEGMGIRYVA